MKRPGSDAQARGFTLVELSIALTVLVILLTMAMPSFSDYLARHRLLAAAEKLKLDMTQARFNAARLGAPVYVSFAPGPEWCWAVSNTPGCDCHLPLACQLSATRHTDANSVQMTSATTAFFQPDGSGQGRAEFTTSRGQTLRVEVARLGRVSICSSGPVALRQPAC